MTRNEFNILFKNIQTEYSNFNGDYDEWYGVLMDYSYDDILKSLKKRNTSTPPIHIDLIKGLKKETKIADWITECEYCKKRITIHNNDMTEFEKHHRKCSKIDFINTMSLKTRGEPINKQRYYDMTEGELETNYRKVMDYYLKTPKGEFIKKI